MNGLDKDIDVENIIFSYIDEFKFLFFPDQWSKVFLDYSKNEILAMLFLYRINNANMTEISEYIHAPLNTTTGVINRLEKKKMVERIRSKEDRRIVHIALTEEAKEFLEEEKKIIGFYIKEVYKRLTDEEKTAAMSIFRKVREVLHEKSVESSEKDLAPKKVRKITIE